MKSIAISQELKLKCPTFHVGVVSFQATVTHMPSLNEAIMCEENRIVEHYTLNEVLQIPSIDKARKGYKALGKDPSRYRLAVESLYRRIVKGNQLYRINNLVDCGNLLSLKTAKSIAVLDEDMIDGHITIQIGKNEVYEGINRGILNIENIPIYCDSRGPFGSPTSDTSRTMITEMTKKVLVFIISFEGIDGLLEDLMLSKQLFSLYGQATLFETIIL